MKRKLLYILVLLLTVMQGAWATVAVNGKLSGAFSVSATKQVWFSQGNLQHSGANTTGTWSFAANQYDRYGTDQTDDHRDLFGWGTKTTPNNTSTNDDEYTWADWGENKISNGGNLEGIWSTLTAAEWQYLFNRTNYRTMATVHSVPGLIMMPDGWTATTVNPTITVADYTTNVLTDDQWTVLEGQGCVFLPTDGWRDDTNCLRTNEHAIYWTSSTEANTTARDAYIDGIGKHDIWTNESHLRHLGFCVRLVLEYWQGSGTAQDPYLINNTYDWNKLSYLVNNGQSFTDTYFRLTADIDVTTIVGSSEKPFSGTFDSNGHSIQTTTNNWSYISSGNVLSAYGEGGYTAENPLSITISAPADLQFDGTYKPATISNTSAWTVAGLTVPTIYYNGITNAPSLLGDYTASITAGGATAEVTYTIKSVINYQSFFDGGLTRGKNFDVVSGTGAYEVALNNSENKGVYWDPVEKCAVFDGEAYLQIDNPLGNVTASSGLTITMDVWISSDNNGSGYFYRSTGAYVNKNGWQRLFELSDGVPDDCIFINAGNANNGTAHLMWCLRKGYEVNKLEVWNNTGKSYNNQWCTVTMVVAPGGYTTLYVNGEVLTHSSSEDVPKIVNVLNYISSYDKCHIGTSIFEVTGSNADGFFFGKIRGFQTAEGALMPYYDGTNYHYLLSYVTNGGNPITGTFEATIPETLPTPTHPNANAEFLGWYTDEELTIPATTGATLTRNTALYAKWKLTLTDGEGITALSAFAGKQCNVIYSRSFTKDKASTVCLPFAYAPKTGEKFYTFTGITKENGEYIADMTEYEGANLVANTPYLYMPSATGIVDFSGTYSIPADLTAGSTTSGEWTFLGTYTTESWTTAPTGIYGFSAQNVSEQGISQGEFVKVGAYVRVKPMRCYLKYKNGSENYAGAAARGMSLAAAADNEKLPETIIVRLVNANGSVTAIGTLHTKTGEVTLNGWYTLDGTHLSAQPTRKGIYVNNGKKVIIK